MYAYQFPPKGKERHLTKEIVDKVKEIAGEYFTGELLGESGSDKVRFALYFDEEGNEKLYLLNTEFSVSQNVLVHYRGKTQEISVPPRALTWIDFKKE